MLCTSIKLTQKSDGILKTYILDDEKYMRKGTVKPAVIICPGGGYSHVSFIEGEPVAIAFANRGYHAFVLEYSLGIEHPFPCQLVELALAVKYVKEHSDEWLIDPDRISVAGFSAGGHMAMSLGEYYTSEFLQKLTGLCEDDMKVQSLVLGYPAFSLELLQKAEDMPPFLIDLMDKGLMPDFRGPDIRQIMTGKLEYTEEDMRPIDLLKNVNAKIPPCFIFGCYMDDMVPLNDLLTMAQLLKPLEVPFELHIFNKGCHGFGLYKDHCVASMFLEGHHMEEWFENAIKWLGEIEKGKNN